jgi:hypothetical protein
MKYRLRAQGMLHAVRVGLARLNRVLSEAGSSDEDVIFHIRKSEAERLPPDQAARAPNCRTP